MIKVSGSRKKDIAFKTLARLGVHTIHHSKIYGPGMRNALCRKIAYNLFVWVSPIMDSQFCSDFNELQEQPGYLNYSDSILNSFNISGNAFNFVASMMFDDEGVCLYPKGSIGPTLTKVVIQEAHRHFDITSTLTKRNNIVFCYWDVNSELSKEIGNTTEPLRGCPECGYEGHWVRTALVCNEHGVFGGF